MIGAYFENFAIILVGTLCMGVFCQPNNTYVGITNAYWHAAHGNLGLSNSFIRTGVCFGQSTPVILSGIIYKSLGNSLFAMWSTLLSLQIFGAISSVIYVFLFSKYEYYCKI